VLLALGAVAALVLGGCNFSYPTFGASHGNDVQGQDIAKLYSGMFIAGLVVAAIVWGLIFWCVVRYRRRKHDTSIPRQFQEHIALEITYTIIPVLIVVAIFVFTVVTENRVDAVTKRPAVTVDVTAYQWGWVFRYRNSNGLTLQTGLGAAPHILPSSYASPAYPQLVLPEHETTKIVLRSADVVHEFYIHAFNFGRYAQPGVTNVFDFTPTTAGVFPAQCSEYCGLYHAEMLFSVAVVSQTRYRTWLATAEQHPNRTPHHLAITQS
jgi:cytochrome c oxidase subunit 2